MTSAFEMACKVYGDLECRISYHVGFTVELTIYGEVYSGMGKTLDEALDKAIEEMWMDNVHLKNV